MVNKRTMSTFIVAVVAVVAMFLLILLAGNQAVMGDPVGSTGVEEKPSGPDGPGGDDIEDLLSDKDDDEADNGLWQANVGGTDFSDLNEDNVGDVLFRGKLTTRTFIDEDGNERSMEVCADIPEIETSKDYRSDTPGSDSIELLLDFSTCIVSVASVTYGIVDEGREDEAEELPQPSLPLGFNQQQMNFGTPDNRAAYLPYRHKFDSHHLASPKYASFQEPFLDEALPPRQVNRTISADIRAKVIAADGAGFLLTQTQLQVAYSVSNMNIISYHRNCEAHSPAAIFRVRWYAPRCYHGRVYVDNNEVRGYVRGTYYATLDHSRHQSSVSFSGYSNRYRATCWWDDDLDHLKFLGFFGVRLQCDE